MNEKWEKEFFEWKDGIESKFNNLSQKNTELEANLKGSIKQIADLKKEQEAFIEVCQEPCKDCKLNEHTIEIKELKEHNHPEIIGKKEIYNLDFINKKLEEVLRELFIKGKDMQSLYSISIELLEKLDSDPVQNRIDRLDAGFKILKKHEDGLEEFLKGEEKKEIIEVYEGEYEEIIDKITDVTNYLKKVSKCEFCNGVGFFEKEGHKTIDCVHCEGTGLVKASGKKEECLLKKPHASAVSVERKLIEKCQCPIHKDPATRLSKDYKTDFLKVYNDALKKIEKKKEVFGDGWIRCLLTQLENSLHIHAEKPYWNKRKYDYDDLLDIINYCLFIAVRIKQEEN
jgi:hypothetical protein